MGLDEETTTIHGGEEQGNTFKIPGTGCVLLADLHESLACWVCARD